MTTAQPSRTAASPGVFMMARSYSAVSRPNNVGKAEEAAS